MEIKTLKDLVCLVNGTTLEKFLYKTKTDLRDVKIYFSKKKSKLEKNILIISKNSFKNVSTLENLSVMTKNSLTIEESAFENCSKLKTFVLEMENKELQIQSDAFKSCNELDCVYIKSAGKITIEKDAFSQCYDLRVVVLDSKDIKIRDNAFDAANNLCIMSKSDDVKDYCAKHNFEYKELKNE